MEPIAWMALLKSNTRIKNETKNKTARQPERNSPSSLMNSFLRASAILERTLLACSQGVKWAGYGTLSAEATALPELDQSIRSEKRCDQRRLRAAPCSQ